MDTVEAYAALGLQEGADAETIRATFRRAAKACHPDLNADPGAALNFARLREAYDALAGVRETASAVEREARANGPANARTSQAGGDLAVDIIIDLETAAAGGEVDVGIAAGAACARCTGSGQVEAGSNAAGQPKSCPACTGKGSIIKSHGLFRLRTPCVECRGHGTVQFEPCPSCAGTGQHHAGSGGTVTIPRGIADGTVITLPGRGHPGAGGGLAGTLRVTVRVADHPRLTRHGDDLAARLCVPFADLCLGGRIETDDILGDRVRINIPPGTQPGTILAVRGRGMPGTDGRGRMLLTVETAVPVSLNPDQRAVMEQWRRCGA